jgi:hypothetical protein
MNYPKWILIRFEATTEAKTAHPRRSHYIQKNVEIILFLCRPFSMICMCAVYTRSWAGNYKV